MASQFDFDATFGLVDDAGETGSGFGDRIRLRRPLGVHRDVHERNRQNPQIAQLTNLPALVACETRVLLSGVVRCMVSVWHASFRPPFAYMKRMSEP